MTSASQTKIPSASRLNSILNSTWGFGILIALVGLTLRFLLLGKESLWFDEAFSVAFSSQPASEVLAGEANNPPVYFLMLHGWMKVFGTSEWAVRSLSIAPSIGAVLLTWGIGRELFGRGVGMLAAILLSLSPFQIYYAQEARGYSWFLFFVTLAAYATIRIRPSGSSSSKEQVRWLSLWCLSGMLAMYTHLFTIFFLVGLSGFVLYRYRDSWSRLKGWFVAQAILILLIAPAILQAFQAAGGSGGGQERKHLLLKLPQAFFSFLVGDSLVPMDAAAKADITGHLSANAHWLILTVLVFGIILVWAVKRSIRDGLPVVVVSAMCIIPILIPYVASFKMMMFDERYLIPATPALALFVAVGLCEMYDSRQRVLSFCVTGGLMLIIMAGLYTYYFGSRYGREQWREAVAVLDADADEDTTILFYADHMIIPYRYYSTRDDLQLVKVHSGNVEIDQLSGEDDLFLVCAHASNQDVLQVLLTRFSMIRHLHYPKGEGIDVYRFEQK